MNTISAQQIEILKNEMLEIFQFGYSSTGEQLTADQCKNFADNITIDFLAASEIKIGNNMEKLQEPENDILESAIYTVLINGYDSDGEDLGMGEMGDCRQAAEQIIQDFCEKANIEIDF